MNSTIIVALEQSKKKIKVNMDMTLSQLRVKFKQPDYIFIDQNGIEIDADYEEDFTVSEIYDQVGNVLQMKLKQQNPQINMTQNLNVSQYGLQLNDVQQQMNKDIHIQINQHEEQKQQDSVIRNETQTIQHKEENVQQNQIISQEKQHQVNQNEDHVQQYEEIAKEQQHLVPEKQHQVQEKEGQVQEKVDQVQEKEDQVQEKGGKVQEKEDKVQEKEDNVQEIKENNQQNISFNEPMIKKEEPLLQNNQKVKPKLEIIKEFFQIPSYNQQRNVSDEANQMKVQKEGWLKKICVNQPIDKKKEEEIYQQSIRKPINKSKKYDEINGLDIFLYPHLYKKDIEVKELPKLKVIMLIGQTGSGKSTLLDAIVNYLEDVPMDATFRYKLVDERSVQHSQSKSMTDSVNSYYIKGKRDYPVLLIDTPGFNDTRGISRDQEITQQISKFFKTQIDEIHAICMVSNSSIARLTCSQSYVFSKILEIFGKDIEENIVNFFTFCDGGIPQVLNTIKEEGIPTQYWFKFNNSALYQQSNDPFAKMYWEVGQKSLEQFFDDLKHKFKSQSLKLTKEVLRERDNLNLTVSQIQPRIDQGLNQLEAARKELAYLTQMQDAIDQNKEFKYTIQVLKWKQVNLNPGIHTTNCLKCNFTCHLNCRVPNNEKKKQCSAMSKGNCTQCVQKCSWIDHVNVPYIFQYYLSEEVKTNETLHQKYVKSNSEVTASEQIIKGLLKDHQLTEEQLCKDIQTLQQSLKRITQIALLPNSYSVIDIFDLMIENEKNNKKPGFKERLKGLEDMKKQNQILNTVSKDKIEVVLSDIFKDFTTTISHLKTQKEQS